MPLTYAEALAETEQRILNGARAYNAARNGVLRRYGNQLPRWPNAQTWFNALMRARPNS